MAEEGVDAFVALRSINVEYLTGFDSIHDEEDPHVAVVTAHEAVLLTNALFEEIALRQASLWDVAPASERLPQEAVTLLNLKQQGTVALESGISYDLFVELQDLLKPARVIPAKGWIEQLRRVKDAGELERIAAAQAITDRAFSHILDYITLGQTEREIVVELEYTLDRFGAVGLAFPSIVCAGPNGSLPHAVPGERTIKAGDLLTMDFGAVYRGYCSDMTRTIAVGQPSEEARTVYDTVLQAQLAELATIRAGASGTATDKAGRDIITAAGYGDNFVHESSHGLGMVVHEDPWASPVSTDILKEGNVISCEPAIYLPGKLGVRIEDLVAVETAGNHNFTASPKELIIL
jgi:Xaa-Pro aminopeptidase